jgi:CBS-domain-containing membrane protein
MDAHWHLLDPQLNRRTISSYALQSLLAVCVLIVILYGLDVAVHTTIVAAMGSTAFIVFAMPHSASARSRNVIGGHLMGILAGSLCALLLGLLTPTAGPLAKVTAIAVHALSVGLSILAMVTTDTEHPPAAGTALGLVAGPVDWRIGVFVLASAALLSLARWALRSKLRDLV